MKSNYQPNHFYTCKSCGTAHLFQPWTLEKERLVKCSHCHQLNKLPFGSNPMQALVAVLSVTGLVLVPWLIWNWLSKVNDAWMS